MKGILAAAALVLAWPTQAETLIFEGVGSDLFIARQDLASGEYQILLRFDAPVASLGTDIAVRMIYDDFCAAGVKCGGNESEAHLLFARMDDRTFGADMLLRPGREVIYPAGTGLYSTVYRPDVFRGGFATAELDFQPSRFRMVVSSAPEPASWAMMLLGFAGIGVSTRRVRLTQSG